VLDVALLALAPSVLLRRISREAVGAVAHDAGDFPSELLLDLVEPCFTAVILGHIVEQRRGDLLVTAAVLEHERSDAEHVGEIGDVASLPSLASVIAGGVLERVGQQDVVAGPGHARYV
jgi:hypothetical protein